MTRGWLKAVHVPVAMTGQVSVMFSYLCIGLRKPQKTVSPVFFSPFLIFYDVIS